MPDESTAFETPVTVALGEFVYTRDGDVLGVVDKLTDDGFEVVVLDDDEQFREWTTKDSAVELTSNESKPGHGFGEGYLMWRCGECGEMGELDDGMPGGCPNCGTPEEALYRTRED